MSNQYLMSFFEELAKNFRPYGSEEKFSALKNGYYARLYKRVLEPNIGGSVFKCTKNFLSSTLLSLAKNNFTTTAKTTPHKTLPRRITLIRARLTENPATAHDAACNSNSCTRVLGSSLAVTRSTRDDSRRAASCGRDPHRPSHGRHRKRARCPCGPRPQTIVLMAAPPLSL